MNLSKIKTDRCPICGAEAVKDEFGFMHCNGTRQEIRSFSCGKKLEYSPNFGQVRTIYECINHPDIKLKTDKQRKAKEELLRCIEKLDVDDDWKSRVRTCGLGVYNS
jgi:hypothetical protein